MKYNSVVLRIVIIMFITAGLTLSATSSRANDFDYYWNKFGCGQQWPGDDVFGISLSNVWGNEMSFDIDLSVSRSHFDGTDGLYREGRLQDIIVIVYPFSQNGESLWHSIDVGSAGLVGRSAASVSITFKDAYSLGKLAKLLVVVYESPNMEHGFKFCKIWHYANVYTGSATSRERSQ